MIEPPILAGPSAASYLDLVMLLDILLVILVIDCVALTGVILLQRSEGGALGMGGGPAGIFTARGAGDLLTRTTSILTIIFFVLSLTITLLAGHNRATSSVTERLKINPIDLDALAKQRAAAQAQAESPAASSSQAAPPLPVQPQLPAAPTQAPRPTIHAPRTAAGRAAGPITLPEVSVAPPPRPVGVPRPSLNAPGPSAQTPASGAPAAGH